MPPLSNSTQESQQQFTGVSAFEESGVRVIPPECRAIIRSSEPAEPPPFEVTSKLLEAHLPLVHQVVAQVSRRLSANVQRDDLFTAGVLGLFDSLRKNGGDAGQTFEAYARTRIRGAVFDELRAQDWLSRRARDAINAASARDDVEGEAAIFVSIDEISADEEQEFLISPFANPAVAYEKKETLQMLARAIDQLPERERRVIVMYYFEHARFKEIGLALGGVSEPRVSQIHSRALGRMKDIFEDKKRRNVHRTSTLEQSCDEHGFVHERLDNPSSDVEEPDDDVTANVA